MNGDAKALLFALAAGVIGGLAMYASQFLTAGPSPRSIQTVQVQRELISTAVLGLAAVVGYTAFGHGRVRDSIPTVVAVFLVTGIVGYGVGFAALWMTPPDGFTLGSTVLTFTLVFLQEVVPFSLAGAVGAAVRALGQ